MPSPMKRICDILTFRFTVLRSLLMKVWYNPCLFYFSNTSPDFLLQVEYSDSSYSCPKTIPWPLPRFGFWRKSTTPTLTALGGSAWMFWRVSYLWSGRASTGLSRLIYCTDNWSPALQIRTILLSIQALLGAPNPDDPLANDVAQRWKEDEPAAIQTAKEWTRTHAMT